MARSLEQLRLLSLLHREALASVATTTREHLPAIGRLTALEEAVFAEAFAPLELIQHRARRGYRRAGER